MKILFVLDYYAPYIGGVETVFVNLAERLVKWGHSVSVITSKLPNTKDFEVFNGVNVYRIPVPKKNGRFWFTFVSIPSIWKLAKNCDIVHTTTWNGVFPAWLVAKLRRKPCVITVNEVDVSWELITKRWFSAFILMFFERIIFSLPFDRYITISQFTHNTLIKHFNISAERVDAIYPGIDYDLFDPKKANGSKIREKLNLENKFIYMYFGRPGFTKGVEYLIQAVPLISKRIFKSKLLLLLAGDPKDRYESIVKMISDLDIKDKIDLLDPVPREELPNYIAASDCVVVPSLSEGFGFTAVEACAMEKRIVASDAGSLSEVVSGKYVLVESRNPESIAEGIERIYKDEVEDTGEKIFSWDACVEKYLNVYKDITKAR